MDRIKLPQQIKCAGVFYVDFESIVKGLAVYIIVFAEKIHSFELFVSINERSDDDERAKHVPTPERTRAEFIAYTATGKFVSHTFAESVIPDYCADTKGQRRDDEDKKYVVHCLFTVVIRSNRVDVVADLII